MEHQLISKPLQLSAYISAKLALSFLLDLKKQANNRINWSSVTIHGAVASKI